MVKITQSITIPMFVQSLHFFILICTKFTNWIDFKPEVSAKLLPNHLSSNAKLNSFFCHKRKLQNKQYKISGRKIYLVTVCHMLAGIFIVWESTASVADLHWKEQDVFLHFGNTKRGGFGVLLVL